MSAAEGDGLLIHTINSFGKQHHLNSKHSQPNPFPDSVANVHGALRSLSQPLPKGYEPSNGREAVIAQSGGASHAFWFDAEACTACDNCGTPSGHSSGTWHDAVSEGVAGGLNCSLFTIIISASSHCRM